MYMFERMIEMGLEEGESWKSESHKRVSINALIQNPRVFTKDKMMRNVKIINSIPEDEIEDITISGLLELGCDFL
jgi:hypothetical protein